MNLLAKVKAFANNNLPWVWFGKYEARPLYYDKEHPDLQLWYVSFEIGRLSKLLKKLFPKAYFVVDGTKGEYRVCVKYVKEDQL